MLSPHSTTAHRVRRPDERRLEIGLITLNAVLYAFEGLTVMTAAL